MLKSTKWAALTTAALVATAPFSACAPEEERNEEEMPEVVEVERDDDTGAMELDEEMILGPGDVGKTIIATGWVEGKPVENGFFLRTEHKRIVFVESDQKLNTGDAVRVTGTVEKAVAETFNGWEMAALGEDLNPDLDLWRGVYLNSSDVLEGATTTGAVDGVKDDKEQPRKY